MATLRILAIVGTAVFAALALTTLPGRTQSAGAPLRLTPPAYSGQTLHRASKKSRHTTQRRAATRIQGPIRSD